MTGILNLLMGTVRSAVVTDPYFEYTTLLLPGSGTNGTQNNSFVDSSANAFPITRNPLTGPNAPTQGTFSPFSQTGWGNYFNGSSAFGTSDVATDFQSGDFTIEAWVYLSSLSTVAPVVNGLNTSVGLQITTNAELELFQWTGSAYSINIKSSVSAVALNTWVHVVGVRSGSNASVYVNGSRLATSTTVSGTQVSTGSTLVGRNSGSTRWVSGYISNLRIVKGTAVYDPTQTTLTVPTSPLTAITNTSLLTCQSNRFRDNSTNNYSISLTGTPTVVAFSPFNPSASWSAATYGGSGYFDGSGDYLSVPDNAAFTLGNGDFTVEVWVYKTTTGTQRFISAQAGSSGSNTSASYTLQVNASEKVVGSINSGATNYAATSSGDCPLNAWTHIAFTRDGNTLRLYINGVQDGTASVTGVTVNDSSDILGIGSLGAFTSLYWPGYLSNFRLVKGTCVYPNGTTFTPPTAPLTAITNTSLLLNFTNAGVYDATSKNDLETVGDAQISNAITPKWGSTSIKFDGTGDYLTSNPATTDMYAFGSGDFTIEMWIRWNSLIGTQVFYDQRPLAGGVYPTLYMSGTTLIYYTNGANRITGSTLSTGQWYHIAVARSGTSTKLFVDGVQSGSTYTDSNVYLNATLRPFIGGDSTNIGAGINAYMQDVRVTKGYARYTANFTAPTAAFPTL